MRGSGREGIAIDSVRCCGHGIAAAKARDDPERWIETLETLAEGDRQVFEGDLREVIDDLDSELELDVLRDIRVWLDRVHHQLSEMTSEIRRCAPWAFLWEHAPNAIADEVQELREILPLSLRLAEAPNEIARARSRLARIHGADSVDVQDWIAECGEALDAGAEGLAEVRGAFQRIASVSGREALAMDFGWLYDRLMRLFHIGYNVSADQIDSHHYDLLASEARTASFIAIAKADVPIEHWFHLGRGITKSGTGSVSSPGALDVRVSDALAASRERARHAAGAE